MSSLPRTAMLSETRVLPQGPLGPRSQTALDQLRLAIRRTVRAKRLAETYPQWERYQRGYEDAGLHEFAAWDALVDWLRAEEEMAADRADLSHPGTYLPMGRRLPV